MTHDPVELLPCPFCGGAAYIRIDHDHSTAVYFGCTTLSCLAAYLWEETEAKAIAAWNRRAIPIPAPVTAIAAPVALPDAEGRG